MDTMKKKAQKLHEKASKFSDKGNDEKAIELYLEAVKLDPVKSESYYNLGLIYKYQNKWQESFDYNQKAFEIKDNDEATIWNLAISATALRKWDIARKAWKKVEILIDDGQGPINMNLGPTPIRLNSDSEAEVVWGTRIDPVRARIENIPYPASGFNYQDIILHDGAGVGTRILDDVEYPVFNELELFESSNSLTFIAQVQLNGDTSFDILEKMYSKENIEIEDWTATVRILCKQCSEGTPHEKHDEKLDGSSLENREIGIASLDNKKTRKILEKWSKKTGSKIISFNLPS